MAQSEKLSKGKKEEMETIVKVDGYFTSSLNHPTWVSARENMMTCHKYKEGDQWTSEELAVLKERHQPATVNNQVKVTIDRMVGQFVKTRTRIGYRGRNSPQDEPTANTLTDLFLYIKQNTQLEYEERDMVDDGFTGGFGVLWADITFDDMFKPEIAISHEDCFTIFPDPYSRKYDWNKDAKFICRAKWVDAEEAKELYPDKKNEISGLLMDNKASGLLGSIDSFKNDNYVDAVNQQIRIVECWYKVKEKKSILLFPNGQSIDPSDIPKAKLSELKAANPGYREIDKITHKMKVAVFSGYVLFEHKEVERKLFPAIPYFAHRKKSGEPYSLIFIALTMQDAINKRESKALHLLSANQTIFEEESVVNENELATEVARPDGQIKLRRGGMEKFRLEKNIDMAVSQFNMHNEAKNDYRRITGINPDALGERSEVRSGVGIARKQAMTDTIIAPLFDNIRRTRVITAAVVLELVQEYYTEEKIVYITDDLNKPKTVSLDANRLATIKQSQYDVIVEDMPDVTTLQQEQFQTFGSLLPQILPFGPFWVRFLLQMSDIRDKEALLKQLEQASQPAPADPKINLSLQWTELPAEQQAAFAKKMGMPDLISAIMANPQQPAHISKIQGEVARESMKGDTTYEKGKMDMHKEMMKGSMQKEGASRA